MVVLVGDMGYSSWLVEGIQHPAAFLLRVVGRLSHSLLSLEQWE